jgi:hypothetical protein
VSLALGVSIEFEIFTIYLSYTLGLLSALFIFTRVSKLIGILLFMSFAFMLQSAIVMDEWDYFDHVDECLKTIKDYYACLPLGVKISTHLSQLGIFLIPVSIFMLGKLLTKAALSVASPQCCPFTKRY